MGYTEENNTINSLIEGKHGDDSFGRYGGVDYEHMHSSKINNNSKNPVVVRVNKSNMEKTSMPDPRGVISDVVQEKTGTLEFSNRNSGMLNKYSKVSSPKVDTYTMMDDDPIDQDVVYSAAPMFTKGHGYSAPFSRPSRNQRILDGPTRDGNKMPSVLENRSARMRN
jgi:hypothetical protein